MDVPSNKQFTIITIKHNVKQRATDTLLLLRLKLEPRSDFPSS